MYFDVDSQIEMPASRVEIAIAAAAREVSARRGSIITVSSHLLFFSAPLWRVNGLLWFVVRQLPLGVSHGLIEVTEKIDSTSIIRIRLSLLWLRASIAGVFLLLLSAVVARGTGDNRALLIALLGSVLGGATIYVAAVVSSRKFFGKLLLGNAEDRNNADDTP